MFPNTCLISSQVRALVHANVNQLLGACVEANHVCILLLYESKGSLQDVLENETIKLDWIFKLAFSIDIAQVNIIYMLSMQSTLILYSFWHVVKWHHLLKCAGLLL